MQAVITVSYPLRNRTIQSTFSFPNFSNEIEKVLTRELGYLAAAKRKFTLTLEITNK